MLCGNAVSIGDSSHDPQDVIWICPAIDLANVVADQESVVPDVLDDVKYVIALPTNEDNVVDVYVTRSCGRYSHKLPALDSAAH